MRKGTRLNPLESGRADLDTLQSLVEKSLLRHTNERFWMLETIREYALGRLQATDETLVAGMRFRRWMLRLADEARIELEGPNQDVWLERLHEEQANVREAITLALDARDSEVALRTAAGLSRAFWRRPAEPLGWLERGLALRGECRRRSSPTLCAPRVKPHGSSETMRSR
jgi:hypothetical protein